MHHCHLNILSRRSFLSTASKAGMAAALASLVDIPFVMKRALAAGGLGQNGKKVLFIWLRGANDSLNSLIPIRDPAYLSSRPTLAIPKDGADANYSVLGPCFDATQFSDLAGTPRTSTEATYGYDMAIPVGNGFAALHPSLKWLAPVYNAGNLALVHRVAYPRQSRSHFDSQRYWENGTPNNNLVNDGIFYRTILESGLANTAPLTGVTIQSSLPLILRGSAAAMTNLTDPTRYNLLSIPAPTGDPKADLALAAANGYPFPGKLSRELLSAQYENLQRTLTSFSQINFREDGNIFQDDIKTDGDSAWRPIDSGGNVFPGTSDAKGYFLFPTTNDKNGGWRRGAGNNTVANKYVVDTGHQGFFNNLKSAALVLNNTEAIIAGTEIGGFDTHRGQLGATANNGNPNSHPQLNKTIGWAIYALRKYFTLYANQCSWDNLVVVTLSEFGRTSVENADAGTDHAEAGLMWLAGGGVRGFQNGVRSGVFNCSDTEFPSNSPLGGWSTIAGSSPMFGVANGYLKRNTDYRSVLGELIRKHLGASDAQVGHILPGYADPTEHLLSGGNAPDGTAIRGEVGYL
jgi:uncharacterized protein (DUF1501 family)